jgi:hypothetical protein
MTPDGRRDTGSTPSRDKGKLSWKLLFDAGQALGIPTHKKSMPCMQNFVPHERWDKTRDMSSTPSRDAENIMKNNKVIR